MKNIFCVAMATALTAFSVSTFTSCKEDNDDVKDLEQLHKQDVANMQNKIDELQNKVNDLQNQEQKPQQTVVNGITINEVYSSAYGSYNGFFTNLKTSLLLGYYGVDESGETFPATIKLGQINFSVNPAEVNAEGQDMYLINSLGNTSKIKLTKAAKATDALHSGITRAATPVYSYTTDASISLEDAASIKLDLNTSDLKNKIESLQKSSGISPALSTLESIMFDMIQAMSVERLALKTTFNYESGAQTQVTGYDITAVAVKPLGFGAFKFDGIPGYGTIRKAAESLINKTLEKVVNSLLGSGSLGNIIDKMNQVAADLGSIHFDPSTQGYKHTIYVSGSGSVEIDITPEVTKIYNEINNELGPKFKSMQEMVDAINELISSIQNPSQSGLTDSLLGQLDKFNQKVGNRFSLLFEPVVMVKSNKGFGTAGTENVPAKVSGDVTLYATTYSGEILTPISAKILTLDNDDKNLVDSENPLAGIVLKGLSKGKHIIRFTAFDYAGGMVDRTYSILVE